MKVEAVEVECVDGHVVVHVRGALDRDAGAVLVDVVDAACHTGVRDLVVDLERVVTFTRDGADALARCRTTGHPLPGGVRFRARSVTGRHLILAMATSRRDT